MFNDLEQMENELKKIYSCEAEFSQSIEMQKIISHCGFNLVDLCKVFKERICAGPKVGMLSNSPSFYSNALTIGWDIEMGNKKIRWVYCEDTRHDPPILYVVSFPASHELKYYRYLQKTDKLKVFL